MTGFVKRFGCFLVLFSDVGSVSVLDPLPAGGSPKHHYFPKFKKRPAETVFYHGEKVRMTRGKHAGETGIVDREMSICHVVTTVVNDDGVHDNFTSPHCGSLDRIDDAGRIVPGSSERPWGQTPDLFIGVGDKVRFRESIENYGGQTGIVESIAYLYMVVLDNGKDDAYIPYSEMERIPGTAVATGANQIHRPPPPSGKADDYDWRFSSLSPTGPPRLAFNDPPRSPGKAAPIRWAFNAHPQPPPGMNPHPLVHRPPPPSGKADDYDWRFSSDSPPARLPDPLASTVKTRFYHGEKVRITRGRDAGKTGIVDYEMSICSVVVDRNKDLTSPPCGSLDPIDENGRIIRGSLERPGNQDPELVVGDKVRFRKSVLKHGGQTGKLEDITYMYNVDLHNGRDRKYVKWDEIERIP